MKYINSINSIDENQEMSENLEYCQSDSDDETFISNEELNYLLSKDNRSYIKKCFTHSKSPNPKIKCANKNKQIKMDSIFFKPKTQIESQTQNDCESETESEPEPEIEIEPEKQIENTKQDNWIQPKHVKNNLVRNRNKAFNVLSDKSNLKNKLYRTKYCKSGKDCKLPNCNYAHNEKELIKLFCAFGNECKFVTYNNNYVFKNKSKTQICNFQHINETDENFNKRIKYENIEKTLNIKKI
jgi:hypothetical protein